jgi:NAD(P)-dependent dehydrogenase (short-subunit alcohol dehydrogenase family)
MSHELSGKIAIVTGGAGGIGRATAELFVEEGARVVIADVDAERGEDLAAKLGEASVFKRTDVSRADEVQELVDLAVAHFGGLHVMFNNAGTGSKIGSFLDDDLQDFQRVMAVNLFGVMIGSQRAARHMAKHGGGSIVNTTSIAALRPGGGVLSYRASKAGVILFSQSIAIELGGYGIRVNCIAPGLIPTGITNYDMTPVRSRMQPLNREGMPVDVANAAVYLASDRSAQVTGMVLPVDGGASVGPPARPPSEFKRDDSAPHRRSDTPDHEEK